jgi:hypothetical protein
MCKRISCLCVFSFLKVWGYKKFLVPLRSNCINLETKKTMIVHVASFLESVGGSIDKDHYLRPIPGRAGYAAYCQKPDYTKKQRKEMSERPMVKAFSAICKEASAIMHDEAQKAEWTAKHIAAKQEASKHQRMPDAKGKPAVPARLWDYIRHELSKQRSTARDML